MKHPFEPAAGVIHKRFFDGRARNLIADFDVYLVKSHRKWFVATVRQIHNQRTERFIAGGSLETGQPGWRLRGIEQLFVRRNSPFELNLYGGCIAEFNRTLTNPGINASVEGTSWMGRPGQKVSFNPALMAKPAGVRQGGVGNYNLQTKALEVIVTHTEGLDKDGALRLEIVPKLQFAFGKPPAPLGEIAKQTLADMRQTLMPYWGAGTALLGL